MKHYYEVAMRYEDTEHGRDYRGALHAFETLEEAIEFAEDHDATCICEIGGNWDDWEKCGFCGEWFPSTELNKDGDCTYCEQAIKSHGGI